MNPLRDEQYHREQDARWLRVEVLRLAGSNLDVAKEMLKFVNGKD